MGSPNSRSFVILRLLKEFSSMQEFVSAVIEWGSYPFPSRTRKSSPTSPMVPGPRIRESRSPLDSRGPPPTRQGASSFLQTVPPPCGYTLATTTRQYESLVAHGPLPNRRGASSFLQTARATAVRKTQVGALTPPRGPCPLSAEVLSGQRSPPRPVNTGRYGSQPLAANGERGPSFYIPITSCTDVTDPREARMTPS